MSFEIVGTVSPEEVPRDHTPARHGVWGQLLMQVIDAYKQGKLVVVKVPNRAEYRRMRNGMAERTRQMGYSQRFLPVDNDDGTVTVYLGLEARETPSPNVSVLDRPLTRPKRKRTS